MPTPRKSLRLPFAENQSGRTLDEVLLDRLNRDRVLMKNVLKIWSGSADERQKTSGPTDQELLGILKSMFLVKPKD